MIPSDGDSITDCDQIQVRNAFDALVSLLGILCASITLYKDMHTCSISFRSWTVREKSNYGEKKGSLFQGSILLTSRAHMRNLFGTYV